MKSEKITERARWYDDACGTAHGLELLGERWSLLIVRELMLGPRRFGDLRAGLPGISANVLTQRLETLEAEGVLRRERLPPPASVQVYALTAWGLEAEPVIVELGRWAARSPGHDPTLPLSAVSLMLSFRTMFRADAAAGPALTVSYRAGAEEFTIEVEDGRLSNRRGAPQRADVSVVGPPPAMAALVYAGVPLAELEAQGALTVEGDRTALARLARLFALPEKAIRPDRPTRSQA